MPLHEHSQQKYQSYRVMRRYNVFLNGRVLFERIEHSFTFTHIQARASVIKRYAGALPFI
jgi:hypothetical protein